MTDESLTSPNAGPHINEAELIDFIAEHEMINLVAREREKAVEAVDHLFEEAMLGIAVDRMFGDPACEELADDLLDSRNFAIRFMRGYV